MYVIVVLVSTLLLALLAILPALVKHRAAKAAVAVQPYGKERETAIALRIANAWGAKAEVRTSDGMRCDIVTDRHAVEVDWAHKWPEAIGQALYYSKRLNKDNGGMLRPAILLLVVDEDKDRRHLERARFAARGTGVEVFEHRAEP